MYFQIICSWCNISEGGLEGCSAVWEVIQWIKQEEIPFAKSLNQMVPHHYEDFLPLLKKRFYHPNWVSHSWKWSVIHYLKRSHSGPLLTVPSTYSLNLRGDLTTRVHSSLLDLTLSAQDPELLPHRSQTHFLGLAGLHLSARGDHTTSLSILWPKTQGRDEDWAKTDGWSVHMHLTCTSFYIVEGPGQGPWVETSSTKTTVFQLGAPRVWEFSLQTQPSRSL